MDLSKVFIDFGCEVFSLFSCYFFEIGMASGSAPALANVDVPVVVDIKDHPYSEFKQCPQILKVDDSIAAFSRVPNRVIYVEDVREYIHCTLEDLVSSEIKSMYLSILLNKDGFLKLEFQILKDQGFTNILEMPEFEDEMIRYVLSQVHGEFMWLDRTYKITKEAIHAIIGLPQVRQIPSRWKIPNNEVNKLIGATSDN